MSTAPPYGQGQQYPQNNFGQQNPMYASGYAFPGYGQATAAAFGMGAPMMSPYQSLLFNNTHGANAAALYNRSMSNDPRVNLLLNKVSTLLTRNETDQAALRNQMKNSPIAEIFGSLINLPLVSRFVGGSNVAYNQGIAIAASRGLSVGGAGVYGADANAIKIASKLRENLDTRFQTGGVLDKTKSRGLDYTDLGQVIGLMGARGDFTGISGGDTGEVAKGMSGKIEEAVGVLGVVKKIFTDKNAQELMGIAQEVTGLNFNSSNFAAITKSMDSITEAAHKANIDARQYMELSVTSRRQLESMGVETSMSGAISKTVTSRLAGVDNASQIIRKNNPYFRSITSAEAIQATNSYYAALSVDPEMDAVAAAIALAEASGDAGVDSINDVASARDYLRSKGYSANDVIRGFRGKDNMHRFIGEQNGDTFATILDNVGNRRIEEELRATLKREYELGDNDVSGLLAYNGNYSGLSAEQKRAFNMLQSRSPIYAEYFTRTTQEAERDAFMKTNAYLPALEDDVFYKNGFFLDFIKEKTNLNKYAVQGDIESVFSEDGSFNGKTASDLLVRLGYIGGDVTDASGFYDELAKLNVTQFSDKENNYLISQAQRDAAYKKASEARRTRALANVGIKVVESGLGSYLDNDFTEDEITSIIKGAKVRKKSSEVDVNLDLISDMVNTEFDDEEKANFRRKLEEKISDSSLTEQERSNLKQLQNKTASDVMEIKLIDGMEMLGDLVLKILSSNTNNSR